MIDVTSETDLPSAPDTGDVPVPAAGWRELFSARHIAAALVLAGGVALYAMNTFVTSAVLPSAIDDIGGGQYYAWVTTAYLIASVLASMLVTRFLGALGAARAYLSAFLVFALGSFGAAFAPSMEVLLATRVLQGLGGGLLAGLGYAVIRTALPVRLWTRAAGLISAMWGVGTLIGPALGGLFAQLQFWRGAFGLIGVVALLLGLLSARRLPAHDGENHALGRVPVWSLLLLVLAAATFSLSSIAPVGPATAAGLGAGTLLVAGFVAVDRRTGSSVLPHITYRRGNPLKWFYLTIGILSAGGMLEIFLPRFGQDLAGMGPLLAGLFGAAISVGWSGTQILSASVDDERVVRRMMRLGPVLIAAGLVLFAVLQQPGAGPGLVWAWAGALVLAGTGIGLAFPHVSVGAMRSTDDPAEGAKAAAGVSTAQLIANSISSALVGVLVAVGGPAAEGSSATMAAGIAVLAGVGVVTISLGLRGLRRG